MWKNIKEVLVPETLSDAQAAFEPGKKVFFAGGSYLVAEKSPEIGTLIDINHLIDNNIEDRGNHLYIGAGATLQQLIEYLKPDGLQGKIAECARLSCPSKNLRNQRTIGGEAAFGRTNSDFHLCLHALNANLVLAGENNSKASIRNWNNEGIITGIEIPMDPKAMFDIQRFALLQSAQAFVIIACVKTGDVIDLSAGGEAHGIASMTITTDVFTDQFINDISIDITGLYFEDHFGSQEYKQALIKTGMRRVMRALC